MQNKIIHSHSIFQMDVTILQGGTSRGCHTEPHISSRSTNHSQIICRTWLMVSFVLHPTSTHNFECCYGTDFLQGVDSESGKSYEETMCSASGPRGMAVLGDSISAHFHLPREWFNSSELSPVCRP